MPKKQEENKKTKKARKPKVYNYMGTKKPTTENSFFKGTVSTLVGSILICAETIFFLLILLIVWLSLK